ncbi:MAG: ATP-binding protein [Lysobacterales bacterium]
MDFRRLIRLLSAWIPALALCALLITALLLAGDAETDVGRLGRFSPWLFGGAALAVLLLFAVIVRRVVTLRRQLKQREPGARLALRLLPWLLLLALPPLILVYGFALKFLTSSIDSWFNVRIERALDDALALGHFVIDDAGVRARQHASSLAGRLLVLEESELDGALEAALADNDALQLAVFAADGALIAAASNDPRLLLPSAPPDADLLAVRDGGVLVRPQLFDDDVLQAALVAIDDARVLRALFPLPATAQPLTRNIEQSVHDYRTLDFLRDSLKTTFVLLLSLVLLLAILLAVLAAFALARRLVQPIARLAGVADDIAAGHFGEQVIASSGDEIGALTDAFNRMSSQLADMRGREAAARAASDEQRAWLAAVLERLTSGVLTFAADGRLRSANAAAAAQLALAAADLVDRDAGSIVEASPALAPLFAAIAAHLGSGAREWRDEVRVIRGELTQVLALRGAALPMVAGAEGGHVVVFDDLTEWNRAQREVAWAEVARRLAHEIKNPLTPIRLASERLRYKLAGALDPERAQVLEKTTQTVIAQVDALKDLVDAFADYARTPQLRRDVVDLNALADEVLELYQQAGQVEATREYAPGLLSVRGDRGRLRQLLHNLIKNAIEADAGRSPAPLEVATRARDSFIEISVRDYGPGLPATFDAGWFEPYTSSKPRGTGLGLAIVKRIAEEHGGVVRAENADGGGARFTLTLPLA